MRSNVARTQLVIGFGDCGTHQPEEGQHVSRVLTLEQSSELTRLNSRHKPLEQTRTRGLLYTITSPREAAVEVVKLVNHRNTHVAMLALHVSPSAHTQTRAGLSPGSTG